MSNQEVSHLQLVCNEVRELVLNLHKQAGSGHVGSALSCCEILTFLRFHCHNTGDEIVLSKGHAASALYATLATAGDISREELVKQYYKDGTIFSAHPPGRKLPGIVFATGSLGHGPGLATGLSLANRLAKGPQHSVFCVMSDGELNEGSVWEAFMFSAHHKLNNLLFIIDRNNLQGFGRTEEVLDIEPLKQKFESFGLAVVECEGHSFPALLEAYKKVRSSDQKKPGVIIAHTIKGHGLTRLANTVDCHYLPMTDSDYQDAIDKLKSESSRIIE
jgi:transketolase